jgi:hypothetical protein
VHWACASSTPAATPGNMLLLLLLLASTPLVLCRARKDLL